MDDFAGPPPVQPPTVPPVPPYEPGGDEAGRTGPPWEQEGSFFRRFAETAQAALLEPVSFFGTMRRTGGVGAPIVYGVTGAVIGGVAGALYNFLLGTFMAGMQGSDAARQQAIIGGISTGCMIVLLPIMTVIGLFVSAGITHVMLLLLGAARRGFETTMRVASYAHGSAYLLNLIPICGGIIGAVWALVIVIIGLARSHEISTGKSALAVLLPVALCCVLGVVAYLAVIALVVGAAVSAGHQ